MAVMKRAALPLVFAVTACMPQDDNPLIAATDDQFIRTIGSVTLLGCDVVLFSDDAAPASDANRESCERGLIKRAADAGILRAVTPAHIADPRVKARYEKIFKR
jgi:hypothetical protein